MKRFAAAAVVLALAAGWWGWGRTRTAAAPAAPQTAPKAVAPAPLEFSAADIVTVTPGPLARNVPITGTLRPVNQTIVKAKVAGELRELQVREGDPVKQGQVLGRIDLTEYQARLAERQAQLVAAESQVSQARRTLDNTTALKDRNFVSQSALDAARSGWEVSVGNRDAVAAQLTLARKAMGDAMLIAPIGGVVAERFAQPGEKLPIDGRVLSIVDLSRMEIEAPVPAAEIGSVRIGQSITLKVEGVSQAQIGKIVRIAPATQAGTRSVPVYIAMENRDPSVRAGLFAQGRLAIDQREGVITVPAAAIRDAGARTFVYAIVADKLVERDVQTGLRDDSRSGGDRVEILSGVSAGDRIVATNLGRLRVDSPVRILASRAEGGTAPASGSPASNANR
jgi:membrane fusion protein (multidrug efflux system)